MSTILRCSFTRRLVRLALTSPRRDRAYVVRSGGRALNARYSDVQMLKMWEV